MKKLFILIDTYPASILKAANLVRRHLNLGQNTANESLDLEPDYDSVEIVDFYQDVAKISENDEKFDLVGNIQDSRLVIVMSHTPPWHRVTLNNYFSEVWRFIKESNDDRHQASHKGGRPRSEKEPPTWYCMTLKDPKEEISDYIGYEINLEKNSYAQKLKNSSKNQYHATRQYIAYQLIRHHLDPKGSQDYLHELITRLAHYKEGILDANSLKQIIKPARLQQLLAKDHWLPCSASSCLKKIHNKLNAIASVSDHIRPLITGEAGTGRDSAAVLIHELSSRADAPFVEFNGASMTPEEIEENLFRTELSSNSKTKTVFIDNLDALPVSAQFKLTRWMEEQDAQRHPKKSSAGPVLIGAVTPEGRKRLHPELLFRIGEAELKIPPLRKIRSAIPNLVGDILGKLQGVSRYDGTSVDEEVIREGLQHFHEQADALKAHAWMDGNYYELRKHVKMWALMGEESLDVTDMEASQIVVPVPWEEKDILNLKKVEERYVNYVLTRFTDPKKQTESQKRLAKRLKISQGKLYKLKNGPG